MLGLSSRGRLVSRALCLPQPIPVAMYATRLYGPAGLGGASGGGAGSFKPGRRRGLGVMEAPHSHIHPHSAAPPFLFPARVDRALAFHQHLHLPVPPPPPPHRGRKKTWNFIREQMSYDTFFTMKRLIERSRRPDEVLRWVAQNPAKVSHNHYPVALQRIGQLLAGASTSGPARALMQQPDFQALCDAIVADCGKFDNFSVVNCLYAVAALGLPSSSPVVQVLEAESQSRLGQFNQKDVSMVFSSCMKLHPGSQHPLTEACMAVLEKNLERERHPQTLFLLLSYYKLKWCSLQPAEPPAGGAGVAKAPPNPEQLLVNRKILRLVKHTLASVSAVRDQEMALLDEMLAACACEASNKSLELIFSSHLFYQNRQEKFISSLAEALPKKVDSITPYTMALIAKYIARHRLRETRLLDIIADFLVKKVEYLDSKVIQKLVFPFSRTSYRPSSEQQFFSRLDEALELKALSSPLATVNILMSLFQLGHFPALVLHKVFSPAFISNLTNSPYALIVRRYLSLLDAAVELEHRDYTGPRLQDAHKVLMFDHALTADEVNRKYSYKGLVAEALRQLVGEQSYKQDEVLPPGYYTDFLLWLDGSGRVLPVRPTDQVSACVSTATPRAPEDPVSAVTDELQKFSPFGVEGGAPEAGVYPAPRHACGTASPGTGPSTGSGDAPLGAEGAPLTYGSYYAPEAEYYCGLDKEPSLESQDSSTLSSPPSDGLAPPSGAAQPDTIFQFSIGKILQEEEATPTTEGEAAQRELPGFFEEAEQPEEGVTGGSAPQERPNVRPEQTQIRRVIVSVNDKWHYCHNSEVLVGSRAMRDRHLRLLGYTILQLPYYELEKLNGVEDVKQYLHRKLMDVPV